MRLLPTESLLRPVVEHALRTEVELVDILPLIGAILQYTDIFNYSCLVKVRAMSLDGQSRELTTEMIETRNVELA